MAKSKDYIPSGNDEFNVWQKNLIDFTTPKSIGWGIPAPDFKVVTDDQALYDPLYVKISNKGTRTKADIEAYNEKRKDYENSSC